MYVRLAPFSLAVNTVSQYDGIFVIFLYNVRFGCPIRRINPGCGDGVVETFRWNVWEMGKRINNEPCMNTGRMTKGK